MKTTIKPYEVGTDLPKIEHTDIMIETATGLTKVISVYISLNVCTTNDEYNKLFEVVTTVALGEFNAKHQD